MRTRPSPAGAQGVPRRRRGTPAARDGAEAAAARRVRQGAPRAGSGFTLVELVVVLALLGLVVAVAAPALRRPPAATPGLEPLLAVAREAAVRRGETIQLRIAATGEWRLAGASSGADSAFASGRIAPSDDLPLTVEVSALGSCALDAASARRATRLRLDPLTCSVRAPSRATAQ